MHRDRLLLPTNLQAAHSAGGMSVPRTCRIPSFRAAWPPVACPGPPRSAFSYPPQIRLGPHPPQPATPPSGLFSSECSAQSRVPNPSRTPAALLPPATPAKGSADRTPGPRLDCAEAATALPLLLAALLRLQTSDSEMTADCS